MNRLLELKTILLDSTTAQGVVLSVSGSVALVASAGGTQNMQTDISVSPQDRVTIRAGRVVSKRTGGDGGAVKVYKV